jgi:hypothetical protein
VPAVEKKGLSGRQYNSETSFITWKIELSIGGAFPVGSGLRYNEMMVIPFENCSATYQCTITRCMIGIHVPTYLRAEYKE